MLKFKVFACDMSSRMELSIYDFSNLIVRPALACLTINSKNPAYSEKVEDLKDFGWDMRIKHDMYTDYVVEVKPLIERSEDIQSTLRELTTFNKLLSNYGATCNLKSELANIRDLVSSVVEKEIEAFKAKETKKAENDKEEQ